MQPEPGDSLPTESSGPPDDAPAEQVAASAAAASTGEPRVDAALGRLDELAGLRVHEHPAVFERVHAELSEVLGELEPDAEDQPGPAVR